MDRMDSKVTTDLRDFVTQAYLFGDSSRLPGDEVSLLASGILDSTGVLELIEYIESKFQITVLDTETVPENLDSIANLTRYVSGKVRSAT